MGQRALIDHDLHVHTALSACCKDPENVPGKIIARAAEVGLKTIGFSDHMWDSAIPGASDWYRPQDFAHLSQIRRQLPRESHGVRVLIGCESEYLGGGKAGISPEVAQQLDFVLLPISHVHMKGFVVPASLHRSEDVAALMVERFCEVMELGLATGIPHPFMPLSYGDRVDEIIGCISDGAFAECFGRAAEAGVSIEVTTDFFPGCGEGEKPGHHDETFLRPLTLARQAGCVFHFASDSHTLKRIGAVRQLEKYVQQLGITAEEIHPLVRSETG